MKAQILKSMVVDGRLLEAGSVIDVKSWKHAKALNRNRYIKILDEEVKPTKAQAKVEEPKVEAPKAEEVKPKAKKAVAAE